MKKILPILLSVLVLIAGIFYILVNFVLIDQQSALNKEPQQSIITPQPTGPTAFPEVELSEDWTRFYDASTKAEVAYPFDWTPRPATGPQGETAVYSFDPSQEMGRGGVPVDELKVGVIYFGSDDDREIEYSETEIISEEEVTVNAYPAVRMVVEGAFGQSINTQVDTASGEYLISAYPAESDLIEIYDQILEHIKLDADIDVSLSQPKLGDQIESPVTVQGKAPGTWFFEAALPVEIETADGQILAEEIFITERDWMTEELLDFEISLDYDDSDANFGFIKVVKNDVSDIPRNKHFFYWPVRF
jgi:uncharacterized protein YxeA